MQTYIITYLQLLHHIIFINLFENTVICRPISADCNLQHSIILPPTPIVNLGFRSAAHFALGFGALLCNSRKAYACRINAFVFSGEIFRFLQHIVDKIAKNRKKSKKVLPY